MQQELKYYAGLKDNRIVVVNTTDTTIAYHEIGKVLGIDSSDIGNIDLDDFCEIVRANDRIALTCKVEERK